MQKALGVVSAALGVGHLTPPSVGPKVSTSLASSSSRCNGKYSY
jgi:hypothetical protein